MAFNDDLQEGIIDMFADVLSLSAEGAIIAAFALEDLRISLEKYLLSAVDANKAITAAKQATMLREVDSLIDTAVKQLQKDTTMAVFDAGMFARDRFIQVFDKMGVSLGRPIFTKEEINALSRNAFVDSAPLKDWMNKLSYDTRLKVSQQIRAGILASERIPEIVDRIIGRKTGRKKIVKLRDQTRIIQEYEKSILNISRTQAESLVRTAILSFSNQVVLESYQANSDVIKAVMWVITLDDRTCPVCQPRQGWAWNIKTGKPIETYNTAPIDFPGPPPAHIRCRCILVPITYSWEELSGKKGLPKTDPDVRASMDGQVPADLTFDDWLRLKEKTQPGFAERVLGKTKYQLFKSNKAGINDFINESAVPYSSAELRSIYKL